MHLALILESWSQGERATLQEAAPAWWPDAIDDIAGNLQAVELIDGERRIPEHAWEAWYGLPATVGKAQGQWRPGWPSLVTPDARHSLVLAPACEVCDESLEDGRPVRSYRSDSGAIPKRLHVECASADQWLPVSA